MLVNDMHLTVDQADDHGITPTHIAAWTGDLSTLAVLLSNGANRSMSDVQGRTPLHYAVMRRSVETVDMLMILQERIKLANGKEARLDDNLAKKWRKKMLVTKDSEGRTALDYASMAPRNDAMVSRLRKLMQEAGLRERNVEGGSTEDEHEICEEEEEEDGGWCMLPFTCRSSSRVPRWAGLDALPKEIFLREHFVVQRPLLLAGSLLRNQHIWAHWRRLDFLARYGRDKGRCIPMAPPLVSTWIQ